MKRRPLLADFVFGRRSTRRSVLEILFAEPSCRVHLRELARRSGFSAPMVAKELARLLTDNVVIERKTGNMREFQANLRSPLAEDIRRIAVPQPTGERPKRARADPKFDARQAAHRRPSSLREAAEWGVALGNRDAFLREFCDEFYTAEARRRGTMLAEAPPLPSDDERAVAYYAAVAEHLALSHGLPVPAWALEERTFLRKPFFPSGLESLKATLLVESPTAFRRRMIFVGADPLYRPRRATRPRVSPHSP